MKNILWLASWYPNSLQPYTGDFIERHARAASLYNNITVLFLIKDIGDTFSRKYFIEEKKYNDHCRALILYYKPFSKINFIESLFSGMRYCIFLAEMIRQYIHDNGRPDLLHVQVCWKAGLLALYTKWKYGLDYVISEHWSVFAPGATPPFDGQSFIKKVLIGKIYRSAVRCSAVSRQLSASLVQLFAVKSPDIIPNVVDTELFNPVEKTNPIFRFICAGEFNYQKNTGQVFDAIALLKSKIDGAFEVRVFTSDIIKVNALAATYCIQDIVHCSYYVPQALLALEMQHSDALIHYSRFETFGCVVAEALVSGIPVIVSDIPVMHELVDGQSGVIVPLNNPALLAEKMLWMMENNHRFGRASIAAIAGPLYSFGRIGKMFDEFYEQAKHG